MATGSANSQTAQDLRSAGVIAIAAGLVWTALPLMGASNWLGARLLPAIPLAAAGVGLIALTMSKTFLLDRQTDEVDKLIGQVATRQRMPEFALAGRNTKPVPWTKLPFFGLFLGVLALSTIVRVLADPAADASWSGAAVGFAASGLIMVTVGMIAYRRMVAHKAALIDRLRAWLADNPPSEPETA